MSLIIPQQNTKGSSPYHCREWKKTKGHCKYGLDCKFLHVELDLSLDSSMSRAERTKNAQGKPKRIKKRNKQRNKIFCYWLVNEFGLELLRNGSGVLDVAGGQGEVSFILQNIFDVHSTIVDPRDRIDYSKFEVKLEAGNYHSSRKEASKGDLIPVYPAHLKLFFTPVLWECVFDEETTCNVENYDKEYSTFLQDKQQANYNRGNYFSCLVEKARNCWNPTTLLSGENKTPVEEIDHGDSYLLDDISLLLEQASCVIGMHPDQATEAIVDFALLYKKPFAIIPCCVCSKQFSKRKYGENLVKSYSDLISHVQSKHENIKVATLPFEGKNTVLYWHG